jgi:cell division protein FtsA
MRRWFGANEQGTPEAAREGAMREHVLVGVDVGSTKTAVVAGELDRAGQLHLRGVAEMPTQGLRRGGIAHMDEVAAGIAAAVEGIAHQIGHYPASAICAITGPHIASCNHRGAIAIVPANRDIEAADVARVLDVAGAIPLETNRMILAVLPRMYVIDGQDGIKHPVGMAGFRLEAEAHVVTGAPSAYRNLLKCVERAHLRADEVVVAALAAAEAVLTPAEREAGVVLIDLGGGMADVTLFAEGGAWRTFALPLGGQLITDDIAYGLRLPLPIAEALKMRFGTAIPAHVPPQETIDLSQLLPNCQEVAARHTLATIIHARAEEILTLLRDEIRRSGRERAFAGGVVLTGGAAELAGMTELAAQVFDAPVRLGVPHSVSGATGALARPAYATAIGLLRWQAQMIMAVPGAGAPLWRDMWERLRRRVTRPLART